MCINPKGSVPTLFANTNAASAALAKSFQGKGRLFIILILFTKLKMVSLYDFMLHSFKGKGHCVVIDSAYMGDAMCQVGREVWGINMVGTCQTDCTGAGALGKAYIREKEILTGSHESLFYQHQDKSLKYAVWGDNNFVKTLSNFHSPVIIRGGMMRKKRDQRTKKKGEGTK